MSILVTLLPIIVMLVLLFLIWSGIKKAGKNLFNNRRIMIGIFVLYAVVLVICAIGVEALSEDDQPVPVNMKNAEKRIDRFNKLIREGNTEAAGSSWLRKEWEFQLPGDELVLKTPIGLQTDDIIVEQLEEEGENIKVSYYSYAVNGGLDYTEQLPVPEIEMTGNELRLLGSSEQVQISMTMFKKEFPISQFTGSGFFVDVKETEVIYLQIPRNVTINNEGTVYLEYVGQ